MGYGVLMVHAAYLEWRIASAPTHPEQSDCLSSASRVRTSQGTEGVALAVAVAVAGWKCLPSKREEKTVLHKNLRVANA